MAGGDDKRTPPEYNLGALKEGDSAESYSAKIPCGTLHSGREDNRSWCHHMTGKTRLRAALLSLVFPGLGQIYNGENFKGFLLFFWTLAGLIMIIPGIIIWVYGIYDARKVALKMNSGVIPSRRTDRSMIILYFAMLTTIGLLFVLPAILL